MKTILITGGAGYVGSHCVKDLMRHGYRCVVLDNLSTGYREAVRTEDFIEADLADKAQLSKIFKEYSFDGIVHFAASTQVGESVEHPIEYYANNVMASLNLLEAMVQNGVKNIVFSSTCAIYGEPQYIPLDEAHPREPINPYGKSKLIIESILEDYKKAYGIQYTILRYFNVAGCDLEGELGDLRTPPSLLIPLILETLTGQREFISVYGNNYDTPDGTCIRDYIHVEDIVHAHRQALEKMQQSGDSHTINLGTGKGSSVMEIIQATEEVTGQKVPHRIGKRRAGDPAHLVASNQKAKNVLGWEPAIRDIRVMIESSWRWVHKPR